MKLAKSIPSSIGYFSLLKNGEVLTASLIDKLREHGIDAVNLHHSEWTAGSVALYHRFGRYCLGWDAQQPRMISSLLDMGIDGVFSDHVDRMVDGAAVARGLRCGPVAT